MSRWVSHVRAHDNRIINCCSFIVEVRTNEMWRPCTSAWEHQRKKKSIPQAQVRLFFKLVTEATFSCVKPWRWINHLLTNDITDYLTWRWWGTLPGWCWQASLWWWPGGRSIRPLDSQSWSGRLTFAWSHWSWLPGGQWCTQLATVEESGNVRHHNRAEQTLIYIINTCCLLGLTRIMSCIYVVLFFF